MNTNNKTARMAGFLYLAYIVVHISGWQFRIGFVIDLFAALLFLLTAWALYLLLKPVNQNLALLFLLLNLGGVVMQCASDLYLPASQMLLSGADYATVFQSDQRQALAMSLLYLYKDGFMIAQIFYGAWLFPLGYTVYKSSFLPRILGMVLMIHCITWLLTSLQFFLFPGFTAITYVSWPLGFIAEFGLTLWLLVMGVKELK